MFFTASKLFWFVAAPTNLLLLGLVVAVLLRWMGFERLGRAASMSSMVVLLVAGLSPAGTLLMRPLENRFPQPDADLAAPTGIVVLGGSTNEAVTEARRQVTIDTAATRITTAIALSRRFPDARLVFSGGSGALVGRSRTEAEDTRRLWIELGVAPERIETEDRSRTTFENALFTKRLVNPKPGERWLLVTSAYHMPRAVGVFRAVGFPVIAYPVDYHTTGGDLDLIPSSEAQDNLRRVDIAAKEWIGLAAYYASDRLDVLFPSP